MKSDNSEQPIFLVGAPRSGTTLLAAMLAAHSRLCCGSETHFFRYLAQTDPERLCRLESWPESAVEFLFSCSYHGKPVPEYYGVDKQQVAAYLRQQCPSIPAILASLAESYMDGLGKARWIEKTPNHTLYVRDVRRYFPESPIVRILRDPRAAALSISKAPWSWAPRDLLGALALWHHYDGQSAAFFETDDNCYTLRYEDLLTSPEEELDKLCKFLGEAFEPAMLDTSQSSRAVVTASDAAWHPYVGAPIQSKRAFAWRHEISQAQNRLAEALVGDRLRAYGYQSSEQFDGMAVVFPSLAKLYEYPEALNRLVETGLRFWQRFEGEKSEATVFVGHPERDAWLGDKRGERLGGAVKITLTILSQRISGRRVFWARDRQADQAFGWCSRLPASLLTFVGRTL